MFVRCRLAAAVAFRLFVPSCISRCPKVHIRTLKTVVKVAQNSADAGSYRRRDGVEDRGPFCIPYRIVCPSLARKLFIEKMLNCLHYQILIGRV